MRYIAKILENVNNVNEFGVAEEFHFQTGNSNTVYLQLFTAKMGCDGQDVLTRYVPQGTSNYVQIKFDNLDDDAVVCRVASNPFSADTSIWKADIMPTDTVIFGSMTVKLFEDSKETNFKVSTDLVPESTNPENDWFI